MENINYLYNKYNYLVDGINSEEDLEKKEKLQNQLDILQARLQEALKKEHESGNTSPEFIEIYSKFDSNLTINNSVVDIDDIEYREEQLDKKENYTLSSVSITSHYSEEKINLSGMSMADKIATIYDHTGIQITIDDPEIDQLCEMRFQQFLSGCDPKVYEQQYGEKWKETVEQIYKSSYLQTAQLCISSSINRVDEKNRIRAKALTEQIAFVEEEIDLLVEENNGLRQEVNTLTDKVDQIQKARKKDLHEYKELINKTKESSIALSGNQNSDRTNNLDVFGEKHTLLDDGTLMSVDTYKDGTTKADISNDEKGRFTTYRQSRKNGEETGMQQRVNDAAHVHDRLSEEERAAQQQKYQQLFDGNYTLFSDGTLRPTARYDDGVDRPDMPISEYGDFTTARDRTNETGMQQRVNDVAHVHERMSDELRDIYQQKYEELFGPIVEAAEEPHKRM